MNNFIFQNKTYNINTFSKLASRLFKSKGLYFVWCNWVIYENADFVLLLISRMLDKMMALQCKFFREKHKCNYSEEWDSVPIRYFFIAEKANTAPFWGLTVLAKTRSCSRQIATWFTSGPKNDRLRKKMLFPPLSILTILVIDLLFS